MHANAEAGKASATQSKEATGLIHKGGMEEQQEVYPPMLIDQFNNMSHSSPDHVGGENIPYNVMMSRQSSKDDLQYADHY